MNKYFLFFALLLCIYSAIIQNMRYGVISLILITLMGATFFIATNKRKNFKFKLIIALCLFVVTSMPFLNNLKSDSRWTSLLETIPIALDTTTHQFWRGDYSDVPVLSNGEQVGHSNYMRIAWISKGIEYIIKDPFGIGYGRNIFGHAIEKYDGFSSQRGNHSHSSIIDFTIGVGLIGLIIWIMFITRIILITSKMFLNSENYFALLTVFIVSEFFIRSCVDSNMRDHMFKQFFLVLGIALILTFYGHKKANQAI